MKYSRTGKSFKSRAMALNFYNTQLIGKMTPFFGIFFVKNAKICCMWILLCDILHIGIIKK